MKAYRTRQNQFQTQKHTFDSTSTNKAPKSDYVSFGDIEDQQVHQPRLPEDSALDAMLVELDRWAATHFGGEEMQGELTR